MRRSYLKAVRENDLYLFQKILNKDGKYIYEKLSNILIDNKHKEIAYDTIAIGIWYEIQKDMAIKDTLDYYIKGAMPRIKEIIEEEDYGDSYKLYIDRYDNPDEKTILVREMVGRNHRVIKKIILREFKKRYNVKDVIYEDLIPLINNARYTDYYGNFGQKRTLTVPFFALVVITKEAIFSDSLTIRYDELEDSQLVSENKFSDIDKAFLRYNKFFNIQRVALKFKSGACFESRESFHQDMVKFEKFFYKLICEKGIETIKAKDIDEYIYLFC